MGINLFGGARNNGIGGTSHKNQTTVDGKLARGFKDLLESKEMEAVKANSKSGDTLTISQQGSVAQKLEELERIHKETDYSGMTDIEIIRTFNQRYEEAFPNLLGKFMVNPTKYQSVSDQRVELLKQTVKDYRTMQLNGEAAVNQTKELYGYTGLSNAEIIKKVQEDIKDDGTLESKCATMWQLWNAGVISDSAFGACSMNIFYMQRDAYKKAFSQQNIDMESEHYRNWIKNGGMDDTKISWSELRASVFSNNHISDMCGVEVENELNGLFDMFIKNENKGVRKNV